LRPQSETGNLEVRYRAQTQAEDLSRDVTSTVEFIGESELSLETHKEGPLDAGLGAASGAD